MTTIEDKVVPERTLDAARVLFSRYPPTKSLLVDDSDNSKLTEHILKYRKKAYATYSYPCIAFFMFLEAGIVESPIYSSIILPKLKAPSSALLLDVGCGFGQDIRYLVADGVEPQNLIGFDLHEEFIEFGYGLFRDGPDSEVPLKSTFFSGSIFDKESLAQFDGRVDIIHAASFLHLFSLEKQLKAASRLDTLLKQEAGALITGFQLGVENAGVLEAGDGASDDAAGVLRHNAETFKDFWELIGDGKWKVDVSETKLNIDLDQKPVRIALKGETVVMLRFVVTRL